MYRSILLQFKKMKLICFNVKKFKLKSKVEISLLSTNKHQWKKRISKTHIMHNLGVAFNY